MRSSRFKRVRFRNYYEMQTLPPALTIKRGLLGFTCLFVGEVSTFADPDGQELETVWDQEEREYVVPVLEYSFDRDLEHASPPNYKSAKVSGLPIALRHRIDALWSQSKFFADYDRTASDFPVVAEVRYRLRTSLWSDPERMARARLLDGTLFQALVTREFDQGQRFEMSTALQYGSTVFVGSNPAILDQTNLPVELRMRLNQSLELIEGVELNSARLMGKDENAQSFEQSVKLGLGLELSDELYGQITAGKRFSQMDGGNESSLGFDGALVWQAGSDTQYSLTFNRSTRPSLLANDFIESETVSVSGDTTLSDMWSAYYGVSRTWIQLEPRFGKDIEIDSGEVAVVFSPTQSIRFSGGYVFRSGSLNRLNDDEAEQIIRLSASLLY